MIAYGVSPMWVLVKGRGKNVSLDMRVEAPGNYQFNTDSSGTITEFYVLLRNTVNGVKSLFGVENLTPEALEYLATITEPDEVVEIIHGVTLNQDSQPGTVVGHLKMYKDEYLFRESGIDVIEANGFDEQPVFMGVYEELSGSRYGTCPGIHAIDTVLTLQNAYSLMLEAAEKSINPTVVKVAGSVTGDLDLQAGGTITVRDSVNDVRELVLGNYSVSKDIVEMLQSQVQDVFYTNRLTIKESSRMTATEVQAALSMLNQLLGGVAQGYEDRVLQGIFYKAYTVLDKAGQLPDKPEGVDMRDVTVALKFNGSIARSRFDNQLANIERMITSVQLLSSIDETVGRRLDTSFLLNHLAELTNAPTKMVKDAEQAEAEVETERNAVAQQEALSAQAGAVRDVGAGLKSLGGVEL